VLHDDEEEVLIFPMSELPPDDLDAKVDIFFFTWALPQVGQVMPVDAWLVNTNFSKGFPQSLH